MQDSSQFNRTVENEYGVDSLIIEFSKKGELQRALFQNIAMTWCKTVVSSTAR